MPIARTTKKAGTHRALGLQYFLGTVTPCLNVIPDTDPGSRIKVSAKHWIPPRPDRGSLGDDKY